MARGYVKKVFPGNNTSQDSNPSTIISFPPMRRGC